MTSLELQNYIKQAFNLGQTYWQQADSEFISQQNKSDVTFQKYKDLLQEASTKLEPK